MTNTDNIILATDSYKLNHWNQYPKGTEAVYSYFEARNGADFPETVFFGLQYILKHYLQGNVVSARDINEAEDLVAAHLGDKSMFNRKGWEHILTKHGGRLPLRIKAVPEGTPVTNSNVLMTVENTDPECFWLTNAVESLLTHVWHASTVATLSRETKKMMKGFLDETSDSDAGLPFMLHDFGYRGVSSHESAGVGGMGHLVNFLGTDTVPAMLFAQKYYDAPLDGLAYSVAATEHSIMTSLGREGEYHLLDDLLSNYPAGILSVVSDSYDIYEFVKQVGRRADQIKERAGAGPLPHGVFVVRPDSVTPDHPNPENLVVWIADRLWQDFGGAVNSKGYRVIDPHVRILWGDGIDKNGIELILDALKLEGFSAENMATFGMGGGLLQKINRDTQRFAFKSSAQKRDGVWYNVSKSPLGSNKASKAGRMKLIKDNDQFQTISDSWQNGDELQTVFQDGRLCNTTTFAEVRERAEC